MNDESFLREQAREAIQAGQLPNRSPDRMWGGPGTGARCTVCGRATSKADMELEVEFTLDSRPGARRYHFHLRCFSILERERSNGQS